MPPTGLSHGGALSAMELMLDRKRSTIRLPMPTRFSSVSYRSYRLYMNLKLLAMEVRLTLDHDGLAVSLLKQHHLLVL